MKEKGIVACLPLPAARAPPMGGTTDGGHHRWGAPPLGGSTAGGLHRWGAPPMGGSTAVPRRSVVGGGRPSWATIPSSSISRFSLYLRLSCKWQNQRRPRTRHWQSFAHTAFGRDNIYYIRYLYII